MPKYYFTKEQELKLMDYINVPRSLYDKAKRDGTLNFDGIYDNGGRSVLGPVPLFGQQDAPGGDLSPGLEQLFALTENDPETAFLDWERDVVPELAKRGNTKALDRALVAWRGEGIGEPSLERARNRYLSFATQNENFWYNEFLSWESNQIPKLAETGNINQLDSMLVFYRGKPKITESMLARARNRYYYFWPGDDAPPTEEQTGASDPGPGGPVPGDSSSADFENTGGSEGPVNPGNVPVDQQDDFLQWERVDVRDYALAGNVEQFEKEQASWTAQGIPIDLLDRARNRFYYFWDRPTTADENVTGQEGTETSGDVTNTDAPGAEGKSSAGKWVAAGTVLYGAYTFLKGRF